MGGEKERESCLESLLLRTLIPSGPPSSNSSLQRPRLQIPSQWGLGPQHTNLGGEQHSVHSRRKPLGTYCVPSSGLAALHPPGYLFSHLRKAWLIVLISHIKKLRFVAELGLKPFATRRRVHEKENSKWPQREGNAGERGWEGCA